MAGLDGKLLTAERLAKAKRLQIKGLRGRDRIVGASIVLPDEGIGYDIRSRAHLQEIIGALQEVLKAMSGGSDSGIDVIHR